MSHAERPFRFGVTVNSARSSAEWRQLARKIEDLGFDVLLLSDHLGDRLAPLTALAAASQHSKRIRLGSLVYANDYRHPLLLAKEAATLDLLSDGRLEFGIGAGWKKAEYDQLHIPWDPPGVRVSRLEEALHIVRGVWAPGPFTYHGRHYRVSDVDEQPKPLQIPRPPILLGAAGPRMLGIAGKYADIVSVVQRTGADGSGPDPRDTGPQALRRKLVKLRECAGSRWNDIELSTTVYGVAVGNQSEESLAREIPHGIGRGWEAMKGTPSVLLGSVEKISESLLQYRQEFGLTYYTLFEWNLASFAPVIQRLRSLA